MKHKYLLTKNSQNNGLTIQEFAELDKGLFSLVCEERYPAEAITSVTGGEKKFLISALRTPKLFPIEPCVNLLADEVMALYGPDGGESKEVLFDDLDLLSKERLKTTYVIKEKEELPEIDALLGDDEIDEADIDDDNLDIAASPDDIIDDEFIDYEDDSE